MRAVTIVLCVLTLSAPCIAGAGDDFDRFFTDGALRIDLYHTGTADMEIFSLDEVLVEPHWGGNPRALIDTLNYGGYLFRVFDLATNRMIFSRGYCTVFGEWATIDEAIEGIPRTFHESLIMPLPKKPVQIRIERRDKRNIFRYVHGFTVDPDDYHINTERRYRHFKVVTLQDNGPPGSKVDIVILGDGYRKDQMHKFRGDAKRLLKGFFDTEPFKSRKRDFNVRLIETVSDERGVDDPREEQYRSTVLDLTFNFFDIDRYMLTLGNKAMRDIAGNVPYDQIIILANTKKYGGGGIYNLYSIGCSDNEFDEYVFVHEFGHAFGGLGDEYYTSAVAYNDLYPRGVEPWEPNITALLDSTNVKWGDLIAEGTPVPTPDDSTYTGIVGCYEGAGYSAKGLYRAYLDCRMFSKSLVGFCPVCRRAIERMIDFHTR
jgi:hypothetical protein